MSQVNPSAGKIADKSILVDIASLKNAYYTGVPDPNIPQQRVSFGTSGHRGSSFDKSFNEHHIAAIARAIYLYRKEHLIDGPLFIGIDTHALSLPALHTVLEVLAANDVNIMLSKRSKYTPTPVISRAIINYNKNRKSHLADGIVITPSHNPPHQGGIKYNPPNGGPAEERTTRWIEMKANELLEQKLSEIHRVSLQSALNAKTTHEYDYLNMYVDDLDKVIDMPLIKNSGLKLGVDPLGGAGIDYWPVIAERYGLNLTVVNKEVDPTFKFMTVDWDGQIRMDPSSPYAMNSLIQLKDEYDLSFACDTDHDRHGIVTRSVGLMPSNDYLSASVHYLLQYRLQWPLNAMIGKTAVTTHMIDLIAAKHGKKVYEVPAGFKWFADGLYEGFLSFGGEESAGASFICLDGSVWTTDKDGIILGLLAAEMTAKLGKDPGEIYKVLTDTFGDHFFDRFEAPATPQQKAVLKKLSTKQILSDRLAGEKILSIATTASGNGEPIGGVKVTAKNAWFAARPSGTEDIYKIYAESYISEAHVQHVLSEAQLIVNQTFAGL